MSLAVGCTSFSQVNLTEPIVGITPKSTNDVSAPLPLPTETTPEALLAAQTKLNAHLTSLYASLPPRTALIIFTGHSDPRRMAILNARKSTFESAIKSGKKAEDMDKSEWWTAADGRELEEEVERTRRGLLFLGIK